MSKELPYFRFTASEWLNDDISLEDYKVKGVFIDICAYYWFKDCSITQALLEKRFSNAETEIKALFELGIIKKKNNSDFLDISFLNSQFNQLSELRKHRQDAGSKGGKQRSSKPKANLKQKSSYKDKDKDKYKYNNKDKDIRIPFESFWNLYDKKTDRLKCELKWNKMTNEERELCIKNLPEYIKSTPDKKFRRDPETYLNNKSWENEIIIPSNPSIKSFKNVPDTSYLDSIINKS